MCSNIYKSVDSNSVWWQILLYSTFWYLSNWPWPWIQGHRSAKKQKRLCQLSHKVINWFEWNLVYYIMKLVLILFHPFSIYRREPYFFDFLKKKKKKKTPPCNIGLYLDISWPISVTLSMIIETTELYSLISAWMTLTFSQSHNCIIKTLVSIF